MMKPRAVVFDLDGTLVDDTRFQLEAWSRLAGKLGAPMSEAVFHSFNGQKNEDIVARLLGRTLGPALLDALEREKEETYRELYRPHVAAVPGAAAFLARLREGGVKLALATSLPTESRSMVLAALGWTSAFDAVIVSEGLPGKPEPDVFLAAATALDVLPSECLAFEDSWNGVRAAADAGMTVVGLTTNVDADVLLRGGASYTAADFTALPAELEGLLR